MKRILSFALAIVMVLSLVPAVSAAEDTVLNGLTVNGLTVTRGETFNAEYGELTDQTAGSGSIDYQLSGTNIVAVANPGNYSQVGSTLTFKNELDREATLRFAYTFVHQDLEEYEEDQAMVLGLSGDSGEFEKELAGGETYTITVISSYPDYVPAVLTITGLSLVIEGEATVTFQPAENGSYTVDGEEITAETSKAVATGTKYALSATADSGYQFFGWHNGSAYISYQADATVTINENCTIQPVFVKDNVAVFGVGDMRFQSLTEADTYAKNGAVKTIVLMNDGILSGEYVISAGNTLLIPYNDENTVHTEATSTASHVGELWVNKEWERPNAYRTLTMAEGAKLTIQGNLNVGGRHSAGPFLTAGSPSGDLGMIQMAAGSNITVANGGVLHCWGYIYGGGTVSVKNGGSVHENFQFTDFRGGNATLGIAQTFIVFPLSQYYVQNIEVAATFEYGATEYVWGSIYMQSKVFGTSVKFIGSDKNLCMFVPGENGTVTKTYDPKTDRLHIGVDGDGSINPMALELGGTALNTETFVLPINSNMTININSGTTMLDQSLGLLPGVELNIAQGATLTVQSAEPFRDQQGNLVHYKGGNNLIVYDRDQWLNAYKPIYGADGSLAGAMPVEAYFVYAKDGVKRLQPLAYTPTRSCTRTEASLVDAVVNINGKLVTDGFIYTTLDINLEDYFYYNKLTITGGGASVISSTGTGTLVMNNGAGRDNITLQPIQTGTNVELAYLPMITARLQNADGSYTDTMTAGSGTTYKVCAQCGQWYAVNGDPHTVDITWVVDGVESTQTVGCGEAPVYDEGTDPVKEGYAFIGWSTGDDNVPEYTTGTLPVTTNDVTYWACFKPLGDVNLDGDVDTYDLTMLAKHVAGIVEIKAEAALKEADVDQDGDIDAYDLTLLAKICVSQFNSAKKG